MPWLLLYIASWNPVTSAFCQQMNDSPNISGLVGQIVVIVLRDVFCI